MNVSSSSNQNPPAAPNIESKPGTEALPRPFWQTTAKHPTRILVADDESLSAASVILCLRQLGYHTIGPASDGANAVEMAFTHQPQMALLDIRMSTETDGLDAALALFNHLLIPVVIVSAYADRDRVDVAVDAGVFGYLVKPVTKDDLGPAIEIAWARFNQFMAKEVQADVLSRHLEDRRHIDYAKWALVEAGCANEAEAMRELHRRAKTSGRSLGETAREVLGR